MTAAHTVDISVEPPVVAIDGFSNVPSLFWHRVTSDPERLVIREKDYGIWNEYTWADYGENAKYAGLGLMSLGLKPGDDCQPHS